VLLAAIPIAAVCALSGCATPDAIQPTGKVSDTFATPEWAKGNQARTATTRAITQNDLINPDGSCAFAAATDGVAPPTSDSGEATLSGQGPLPAVQSGVGLGMTECQVLERTGAPDTFNISAEGTERIATLTVTRGSWPGLYRFRGGRLASIERVEVPKTAKPARSSRPKKAAATTQPMPLRGAQQ
jgi:hypothetical protein